MPIHSRLIRVTNGVKCVVKINKIALFYVVPTMLLCFAFIINIR